MNRCQALFFLLAGTVLLAACAEEARDETPLRIPKKESTWVRTETVKTTRDEVLIDKRKPRVPVPINETLLKQLTQTRPASHAVTDEASCLQQLAPLDKKITAVYQARDLWGAFERHPELKPYSDIGMQLDKKVNRMVYALRHLCTTSRGVPMDDLARRVSGFVARDGREATLKMFKSQGRAPKDIENWLEYAEFAQKNATRVVEFSTIEALILRAEPIINLYEELSRRKPDPTTMEAFRSDAVTLLQVLEDFLQKDETMVMAVNEDLKVPYYVLDGDM